MSPDGKSLLIPVDIHRKCVNEKKESFLMPWIGILSSMIFVVTVLQKRST